METLIASTVIVGEVVPGEAAHTRSILESLIKNIDKQVLDVAELLLTVKSRRMFAPDFNTYKEYTTAIGIKDRRAEYLPKIVEVMGLVGIERGKYEKVAISRLRDITSLIGDRPHEFKTVDTPWKNPETGEETPIRVFIEGFIDKNKEIDANDLKQHIKTLKGLTGENDISWLNLCFQTKVLELTVRPAIEKMKALYGSTGKDSDGDSTDISDAKAVEMMSVEILNDPTLEGDAHAT